MSRLLDRLDKISRGVSSSMGFGATARAEKMPSLALVGKLTDPGKSARAASVLEGINADGALIEGKDVDNAHKKLAQALGNVPWGVKLQELNEEQASTFRERGCDFLAFGPERALVGALDDDDSGYILCIQSDMEERSLRAIEDLPVDAVLLRLGSLELPLTLEHLLTISSVRSTFSKYLLLAVPGGLTSGDLEGLRNVGVDGLVVDATAHSKEELTGLRDRLLSLPRRQRNRSTKANAILPRTAYDIAPTPSHEEEDEEQF